MTTRQQNRRMMGLAIAAVASAAAVASGIGFHTWVEIEDGLLWLGAEQSVPVHYPASHIALGWLLSFAVVVSSGLAAAALASILGRSWSFEGVTLPRLVWLGASVGLAVPIVIWTTLVVATPLIVSAAVAWWVMSRRRRRAV